MNGTFSLPQPLQGLGDRSRRGPARPPTSPSPITFTQQINANDALRTGTYAKTLTFTLSTTNP